MTLLQGSLGIGAAATTPDFSSRTVKLVLDLGTGDIVSAAVQMRQLHACSLFFPLTLALVLTVSFYCHRSSTTRQHASSAVPSLFALLPPATPLLPFSATALSAPPLCLIIISRLSPAQTIG